MIQDKFPRSISTAPIYIDYLGFAGISLEWEFSHLIGIIPKIYGKISNRFYISIWIMWERASLAVDFTWF